MFTDPWFVISGVSHGDLLGLGEIIPFLSRVVGPEDGDLDPNHAIRTTARPPMTMLLTLLAGISKSLRPVFESFVLSCLLFPPPNAVITDTPRPALQISKVGPPKSQRLEFRSLAFSIAKLTLSSVRDMNSFTPVSQPHGEQGKDDS